MFPAVNDIKIIFQDETGILGYRVACGNYSFTIIGEANRALQVQRKVFLSAKYGNIMNIDVYLCSN